MTGEWRPVPDETVLTAQRQLSTGEREQCPVPGEDGLAVRHARRGADGPWSQAQDSAAAADLTEVLRRFPDLTTLAKGAITSYTVDEEVMAPPALASMLTADQDGGPEAPQDWHDRELSTKWAESDEGLSDWATDCTWFARWAQINGMRVSVVEADHAGDRTRQPVLVDENLEEIVPIREIAWESWYNEGSSAPINWRVPGRLGPRTRGGGRRSASP